MTYGRNFAYKREGKWVKFYISIVPMQFWDASDIAISPTDVVRVIRTTGICPQLPPLRVFCSAMSWGFHLLPREPTWKWNTGSQMCAKSNPLSVVTCLHSLEECLSSWDHGFYYRFTLLQTPYLAHGSGGCCFHSLVDMPLANMLYLFFNLKICLLTVYCGRERTNFYGKWKETD